MKAVMLRSRTASRSKRLNKHIKDDYKTVKPPSLSPMKFTEVNLHELLAELITETFLFEQNEVDFSEDEPD